VVLPGSSGVYPSCATVSLGVREVFVSGSVQGLAHSLLVARDPGPTYSWMFLMTMTHQRRKLYLQTEKGHNVLLSLFSLVIYHAFSWL
jgi:hypothetical protein